MFGNSASLPPDSDRRLLTVSNPRGHGGNRRHPNGKQIGANYMIQQGGLSGTDTTKYSDLECGVFRAIQQHTDGWTELDEAVVVNDLRERLQRLDIPALFRQPFNSFSQVAGPRLQDVAKQLFHCRLQLANDTIQVGCTLRRHRAVSPHVLGRELGNGDLDESEVYLDRMSLGDARLVGRQGLSSQHLQKLPSNPGNIVFDRVSLQASDIAGVARKDAFGSRGIQGLFDVPHQLVDMLARYQQVLALARIQRDVIVVHRGSFNHLCCEAVPIRQPIGAGGNDLPVRALQMHQPFVLPGR